MDASGIYLRSFMNLCHGSVFCTRGVKAVFWHCFLHCGCLSVGARACLGVGVQLWWEHCAVCVLSTACSASLYKHRTCHHTRWLRWTPLICVMTALHCAQRHCCSLCTAGMDWAVWLCYNITGLHAAQLCQAHTVCCVLQWCWRGWMAALGTLQFYWAPARWCRGFVWYQAGRGQRGRLLACLVGMCRISYVICTLWVFCINVVCSLLHDCGVLMSKSSMIYCQGVVVETLIKSWLFLIMQDFKRQENV